MTAGHFSSPNVIDVVAGAPQHNGVGKVGASSFVLLPAAESSCVCFATLMFFFSCTGLHFQNR